MPATVDCSSDLEYVGRTVDDVSEEADTKESRSSSASQSTRRSSEEEDNSDHFVRCTTDEQHKLEPWTRSTNYKPKSCEEPPWYTTFMASFTYTILFLMAKLADWLRAQGFVRNPNNIKEHWKQTDFVSLKEPMEAMYVNNLYRIAIDVVNRPIASVPGAMTHLHDRNYRDHGWDIKHAGTTSEIVNMGSYNYLGFSECNGPCADAAAAAIDKNGLATCSTRHEFGMTRVQYDLETRVAYYLGVEKAICFPMGFGTNSMNIPCLVGKGSLIMSDALNHASLVLGSRMSGATIKVFKHNDAKDLEKQLRNAIVAGQPKTGRPYKKILIIVEGIYSMEGTIVHLPAIIEVKKKYGAYLYLDEAHSVGALGPTGRGVVEYWGCDPNDVDIMMGTLTKSFAAAGGYIGGRKRTIDYMLVNSHGCCYGSTMSAPVVAQVSSSMQIMLGEDGTDEGARRTRQLARNTRYFRKSLRNLGFMIYGHDDSPVVPLMAFFITKVVYFGRETLKRNLGVVSVGFPAAPLTKSRTRFCISASHTKEQLDMALKIVSEIGDQTRTKYGRPSSREEVVY